MLLNERQFIQKRFIPNLLNGQMYTLNLRFSRGFCFTLMKSEGGGTRLWSKRPRGDGGTRSRQMSEEMSRHWSSTRLSRGGTNEPVQPWKRAPCPPGMSQQWNLDFFNVYSHSFWSRQRRSRDSYSKLLFQDLLLKEYLVTAMNQPCVWQHLFLIEPPQPTQELKNRNKHNRILHVN